jgi:hypothetical protein
MAKGKMAVEEVFHFTMEVIFPAVWGGRLARRF